MTTFVGTGSGPRRTVEGWSSGRRRKRNNCLAILLVRFARRNDIVACLTPKRHVGNRRLRGYGSSLFVFRQHGAHNPLQNSLQNPLQQQSCCLLGEEKSTGERDRLLGWPLQVDLTFGAPSTRNGRGLRMVASSSETQSPEGGSHVEAERDPHDERMELGDVLRQCYDANETDGVMDFAANGPVERFSAGEFVAAAVASSTGTGRLERGRLSGVLDGFLGACYRLSSTESSTASLRRTAAQTAWSILASYHDTELWAELGVDEHDMIRPDVVSHCLAYATLQEAGQRNGDDRLLEMANDILAEARRISKKKGGSKRRKELAASNRRSGATSAATANESTLEDSLKSVFGPNVQVLYETSDLIVLNKPCGVVCYHNHKTSSGKVSTRLWKKTPKSRLSKKAKDPDPSVIDVLDALQVPLSTINPEARGIVHRIDRGTSGCLLIAKTDEMHAILVSQFFTRAVHKTYRALLPTLASEEESSSSSSDGMVQDEGDRSASRETSNLAPSGEIRIPVEGRPAQSFYRIIGSHGAHVTEIEMETRTGRKHQVRVHSAKGLQRPILLDPLYNTPPETTRKKAVASLPPVFVPEAVTRRADSKGHRFFLHADRLSIPHLGIHVQASLPEWWVQTVQELQKDE